MCGKWIHGLFKQKVRKIEVEILRQKVSRISLNLISNSAWRKNLYFLSPSKNSSGGVLSEKFRIPNLSVNASSSIYILLFHLHLNSRPKGECADCISMREMISCSAEQIMHFLLHPLIFQICRNFEWTFHLKNLNYTSKSSAWGEIMLNEFQEKWSKIGHKKTSRSWKKSKSENYGSEEIPEAS